MGYLTLDGGEFRLIREKLISAYGPFTIQPLVKTAVPSVVDSIQWLHPGGLNTIADDIVERANQQGLLDQLLVAVARDRPFRPDLRALALQFSTQKGWTAAIETHGMELRQGGLEKLTSPGHPFLDTTRLARWLIDTERQVCQVRCGDEHGSGFLVGPNLVLTCYHVVEEHLKGALPASKVEVRFDYRRDVDGKEPAYDSIAWQAISTDWKIPSAPYSQSDITLEGEPKDDELDFALLMLKDDSGNQVPAGEDRKRGWVDVSKDARLPANAAPVLIVQHPARDGGPGPQMPLQIAFATPGFEKANSKGTRVAYKPSTKPGSSGSPVFGPDFQAVALHHNRGQIHPDAVDLVLNNQGIPLAKIRAALSPETRALLVAPQG